MAVRFNSEEIGNQITAFEKELDALILDYEQFFLGFLKVEPISRRRKVERIIRDLDNTFMGSATLKFRLQTIKNRFVTYREKWNRITRQIEEGTYVRDIMKAKRKGIIGEEEAKKLVAKDIKTKRKLTDEESKEAKSVSDNSPQNNKVRRERPSHESSARTDSQYNILYQKYVNISGGGKRIPFNKWKEKLENEKEKLLSKTNAKDIEFKVVEVNGKPKIKAIPKK